MNILVDFPPVSDYARQITLGVAQFCHEHSGFHSRTTSTETNLMEDADVIDGVIAIIDRANPSHPATRFNKPIVNVSTIVSPVPFPTVAADNRLLGRLAAEHLLMQGYRSFAFHMESRVFFSRERQAGFAALLEESGHRCDVFDTGEHLDSTPAQMYAKTLAWLRQMPKPLGLFTHNDQRATVLIDLCNDGGLNVPEEIGVVGVDNDQLHTQLCRPKLTSVDPGAALIGFRAAELLSRLIAGQAVPPAPIFLPPREIAVRDSTQAHHLTDDRLSAAMRFIRQHVNSPITVDQLLEVVPTSRRSLERLFRVHLGRSPAEEIRRMQINHIKWLLVESDRPLSDLADQCGFSSFRSFGTAFRRETGMSASIYRKRFRPK